MSEQHAESMRNVIVQTIEDRSHKLEVWKNSKADYLNLRETLNTFPDELTREVNVKIGSKAIVSGEAYHTNEILVLLGDNWFTKKTAKQTQEIIDRRIQVIDKNIMAIEAQISKIKEGLNNIDSLESTVYRSSSNSVMQATEKDDIMAEGSENLQLMDIREELDDEGNITNSIVQPQRSSELQEFAQSHLSKIIEGREKLSNNGPSSDKVSESKIEITKKGSYNTRIEEIEEDEVEENEETHRFEGIVDTTEPIFNENDNPEIFDSFENNGLMEIREEIDEDGNVINSSVQPHGQSETEIYMKLEQIARKKEAEKLPEKAKIAGPEMPPDFVKVKDRKLKSNERSTGLNSKEKDGSSQDEENTTTETSRTDKGKQKAALVDCDSESEIYERIVEDQIHEKSVVEKIHEKPAEKFNYEAELKRAQKAIRPEDMIALELIADSFDDEEDLDFDDEEEWDFDDEELDYDDYDEEEQEEDEHGCTRGSLIPQMSERNSLLITQIQQLRQGNQEATFVAEKTPSPRSDKNMEVKREKKQVRFSSELDIKSFHKAKSPSSINDHHNSFNTEQIEDLNIVKSENDEAEEEEPKRVSRFKAERMVYGLPKIQSAPVRVVNNSNLNTRGPVSNIFERVPTSPGDIKPKANAIVAERTVLEKKACEDIQARIEPIIKKVDQIPERVNLSFGERKSVSVPRSEDVPDTKTVIHNVLERPVTSLFQEKTVTDSESPTRSFSLITDVSKNKKPANSGTINLIGKPHVAQNETKELTRPGISRFKQAQLEKKTNGQGSLPSTEKIKPTDPVIMKAAKVGSSVSIKAPQRVYGNETDFHDIESIAIPRNSEKSMSLFSSEMMELATKNYDQAVIAMDEEEYRKYIDKIMEEQEEEENNSTFMDDSEDRPLMSDQIPEHTFEVMGDEFNEEGFAGYLNNMDDSEDEEHLPDLYQREIAVEYQRLRERMINKAGGFGKTDEEKAFEVMDEDGNEVRVSRFKAARLSNRKKL